MAEQRRFEALALPHMDAAYNVAYWIVRDRDDAEDVVQDAFLRAYRAFDGFREDHPLRPWLLAIVRNAAYRLLNQRRRRGNVVSLDSAFLPSERENEIEIPSPEPDSEALMIAEADARQVHAALAALPLAYRDVVVLREMENLAYSEIALVVGVPVGTVMSRLARGRALLRHALQKSRSPT